jgi:hypothetical protein
MMIRTRSHCGDTQSRLAALLCGLLFACTGNAQGADQTAQNTPSKSWLEIYGFAQLDAGYDFRQVDPDWFDVVRPTKLPSVRDQFGANGNTYFSVRQTRFGAKSELPTSLGTLKTVFEFELFGTGSQAGQTTFRLRHAYGELGHFGAGQYWSVFVDTDAFPNSVEYWGPPGLPWFRNVQFRWMPVQGESRITLAVERPGASADQGIYADRIKLQNVKAHFPAPDITGEARLGRKWGYLRGAGLLRRIAWKDVGPHPPDITDGVWGWGVNLSSSIKTSKNGAIKLMAVYGRGVENYMNDAPADVGAVPNPNNATRPITGRAIPMLGVSAYYDHSWSKKLTSTFGYSRISVSNTSGQKPDEFRVGQYASTNLLFTPVTNMLTGGEFIYGYRRNYQDNWHVPEYRIQFVFKYNFSFRIGGTS